VSEASVETLFDEFALAYRRGERPDVGEYLARAAEGTERDDLADVIDRFLQGVPARDPSEEEVVLVQARLERQAPLLALRIRRKLGRRAVVDALVGALGLDPAKSEKVGDYYHRLENGLLDPEPVDARVWSTVSELMKANVRALAGVGPEPLAAATTFLREATDVQTRMMAAARAPEPAAPSEPDEIDKLFTGSA
jgi:hypothetical protein